MTLHCGNVLDVLPTLEAGSAQMCVTSPPYWGLRDYGHGDQFGLEATPQEYVARMVRVFSEVWRVLADDGVLWLNLGDSYNGYMANQRATSISANNQHSRPEFESGHGLRTETLKQKDLVGIPWRVAFALQDAGWYLRQDIIWHKPNPMPESVTDRCTKAHEYLFMLTKQARYFYDMGAIAEVAAEPERQRNDRIGGASWHSRQQHSEGGISNGHATRNRRSVWLVNTEPFPDAHFAVFPPKLIEPCILATSRPGDTVLDPFMGSGTTAMVAQNLNRKWIGVELNPDYAAMVQRRTAQQALAL